MHKEYYLLTEDDPEQAESIKFRLQKLLGRDCSIRWIGTEHEAMSWLSDIEAGVRPPPRGWVADAMMLYARPGPDNPHPSRAVMKEGIAHAGERLRKQARKIRSMRRVPLVFYSAIRQTTSGFTGADSSAAYLSKEDDILQVSRKLKELERLTPEVNKDDDVDSSPWNETPNEVANKLNSDPGLRSAIIEGMKLPWSACKTLVQIRA